MRRIMHLGGLGDEGDPGLSPHPRSRHEVGRAVVEAVKPARGFFPRR